MTTGTSHATSAALITALDAFLAASPARRRELAPALVDGIGEDQLAAVLARTWHAIGPFVGVGSEHGRLLVRGQRGTAEVWAELDAAGRLSALLLQPLGRRGAANRSAGSSVVLISMLAWPVSLVLLAFWGWTATSVAAWCCELAFSSIIVLWFEGFGLPAWSPAWLRWSARAATVAALASAARLGDRGVSGGGALDWACAAVLAIACAALARVLIRARRYRWGEAVSTPLVIPFEAGVWYIAQGGGRALNHHARVPEQRGALDIVALGAGGARAGRLLPCALRDYVAYGQPVLAPCDGTVTRAVDAFDDQLPGRATLVPPAGNHVRIDTGHETVLLAHLRPGSLRVAAGDQVRAGQPIGEIGNSGNTTEPHLHLHAERAGQGLDLRFIGVRGPLCRGRRL